jgi:outer membrane protein assembly factor BamA
MSYYFNTASVDHQKKTRTSNLQFQGVRTMRQQTITQFISEIFTPEERYYIRSFIGYRDYLDQYFGIGNRTNSGDREDYRFKSWIIAANIRKNIGNNHFLGLNTRFQRMYDIAALDSGDISRNLVNGSQPNRSFGFGPEWVYDNRDNVFAPRNGRFFLASLRYYPQWNSSWQGINTTQFESRWYFEGPKTSVFALKGLLVQQFGPLAPFRELAQLGGDDNLRGYFRGRYRDRSMIEVQSEYRFPIWWAFRGAVFSGIGQVGEQPSDWLKAPLRISYGGGIRLVVNRKDRVTLRIDYARTGTGEAALYIGYNEAF